MMRPAICWWVCTLVALVLVGPVPLYGQDVEADEVALPAPSTDGQVSLEAAIAGRRSVKEFDATPLTPQELGQLAWAAQGITEPEKGFRAAPSAAAMYPVHLYLVTADGLYRYVPAGHKLEHMPLPDAQAALRGVTADQPSIQQAPLTVIITADFEPLRERFGERADGFVYMEAGHVGQNLQLQARTLGLGSLPVGGFDPARVAEALSLPDNHAPIYTMPIGHPKAAADIP
jgi:SagB-type dehydrogenase family enzyme